MSSQVNSNGALKRETNPVLDEILVRKCLQSVIKRAKKNYEHVLILDNISVQ